MSRVRGLVLERLADRHAVVLTPHGDFVRVRLPDAAAASPGQEIWGELDDGHPALIAALRRTVGSWPRAFAATALAFGAAGAIFAALYLRGVVGGIPGPAGIQAVPGESTVDANARPDPTAAAVAARPVSAPGIQISEHLEAGRLYASTDFGAWASLKFSSEQAAGGQHSDLVKYIRQALRVGSAAGISLSPGNFGSQGGRPGVPGAREAGAQGGQARDLHRLTLPVVRLGPDS